MKRTRKVGGSRGPGRGTKVLRTSNFVQQEQLAKQLQENQAPKPITYVSGYGFVYAERAA